MNSNSELEELKKRNQQLERENKLLRLGIKKFQVNGDTVSVPENFKAIFDKAQTTVGNYFTGIDISPSQGTIEINGQRYVLVRASALSYEFLNRIKALYAERGEEEATLIGKNFLFDIAHVIGIEDAKNFHKVMNLTDPIERLSAGPVHFAYCGWAFVDILAESKPSTDENFYMKYHHPYSFEADSWIRAGKKSSTPVCVMNSGYSSGWCEESFGIQLTAVEISCRACGDDHCTFIMAPPNKIKEYLDLESAHNNHEGVYDIPMFFERKKAEEKIKASLHEKEMLLKEIHHRVKNNLQIISSLLKLQSAYTETHNINQIIHDSQTRIKAMAIVHEKLYQSNLESVNLGDYIQSIAELTNDSYNTQDKKINIATFFNDTNINIRIDLAISIGLLVNEILTNSIKYAFENSEKGQIEIEIFKDKNQKLNLIVSDNGIGLPKDFDFNKSGTFGMELIRLLTGQIDAELTISTEKGTSYHIRLPIPD